ncbi:LacI family DNA-binding transcriptional regulator [Caldisalinibacter kiritimatiensis]|uniref:Transcriptional regulator n=1 Tax=Caldisalinibacter kiritimatiensis TaxID=1304284 RepID=R1AUK8_9FIRM|nr:LacI family DNA-binding transcriptional regulator [Caldisalinibacter kiritimatiensis]EOD00843.1 Transcriptional regulator [Caldisalinibacter kiritimatiensis]
MKKITIKEIAEMAGVSKATVSRVLNDSKYVSPEIYSRVMKVIEETGYKPSFIARSLVNKKTKVVGLLIPDISNPFYSELVKGMVEVANKYDYNILLCNSFFNQKKEMDFLKLLWEKEVEGIIFMTHEITNKHRKFFEKYTRPTVTVNRKFWGFDIPNVDIDNFLAGYDATEYLVKQNHHRIAIVRAPLSDETAGVERYEGYKKALEDYGIDFDEKLVKEGNFKADTGYKAMEDLLELDSPPTAVFCVNDEMACGVINCVVEKGLKVPEDISVVGFDDIPLASMFIPSITTIRQPIYDMGALSMELMYKMIKGEKVESKTYVLPHKLVVRQSTMKNE